MDLNEPIYRLGDDIFTLNNCTLGTLILGTTGSGKTTGPGNLIARSFLRKGMGGLVLTAKVGETERWIEYAKKEGRLGDLIVFSPDKLHQQFNPLLYEIRSSKGGRQVDNLVRMFSIVMQMNGRASMQSGSSSQDPFWEWAKERLLKAAILLLLLSAHALSMANIVKIIRDALIKPEGEMQNFNSLKLFNLLIESNNAKDKDELEKWGESSFTVHCLSWAYYNAKSKSEKRDFELAKTYFLGDLPALGEKTRSGITEQLFAFIDPFCTGAIADSFTEGVSEELVPELTYTKRKIIVLDFPVKEWENVGIMAQGLYKWSWQKKIEQRNTSEYPNPVFLWQDEYHLFSNRYDNLFQSTARESKACSVVITQNLPNLYAMIGGSNPRDYVHSLIGNLGTKMVCANDEPETNLFVSKIVGEVFETKQTFSFGDKNSGGSFTEQKRAQIEPVEFSMFRNGGEENNFKIDAIVTSTGKKFKNGKNFLRSVFNQNL